MRLFLALALFASPLHANTKAAPRVRTGNTGTAAAPLVTVAPATLLTGPAALLTVPALAPSAANLAAPLAGLAAPADAPKAALPAALAAPLAAPQVDAAAAAAAAAPDSSLTALQQVMPAIAPLTAPNDGPGGGKAAAALDGLYTGGKARADDAGVAPGAAGAPASMAAQVEAWLGPVPAGRPDSPQVRAHVGELKHVLGDAGLPGKTMAWPVTFGKGADLVKARGTGLEGFLYSKLEHEKTRPDATPLIGDYFRHVNVLLSAAPWARGLRDRLDALGRSSLSIAEKNARLNEALVAAVGAMQARLRGLDPSLAGRRNATYTVLARGYNRLQPGKDFFASFDAAEFARIKKTGANEIWLMDVFEIGEVNRWGSGGGSAYSLKAYRAKKELGGDAGLKAFVKRAHAAGLKVKLDFVPNHTSLDSDRLLAHPEDFLHVVPPQHLTDAQIMAQVPREDNAHKSPLYRLVRVDDGRRILVHHPRTDLGAVTWVDMAQVDFSRRQARERLAADLARLIRDFGVDSVRRDMAYEMLSSRFHDRWVKILKKEIAATPEGWMKERSEKMLAAFSKRWKSLGHAEVLALLTAAAKQADPAAILIDEAYDQGSDISRTGSDGVYNKNDHDLKMGQVGLYDAMRSGDPAKLRAALRHAAFRRWQVGGAAAVNYLGTHEEFEGNPVDVFGKNYRPAALTALLLRPLLMFNGFEQGVGQERNVIGDLSKSQDKGKALPFDVPVKLDWTQEDAGNRKFLEAVLAAGERHQGLLDRGVMDVLASDAENPLVAWTAAGAAGPKLLMAANYGDKKAGSALRFDSALAPLGAFRPKAGLRYVFKDVLSGKTREHDGADLLESGFVLALPAHGTALFEVTELGAGKLQPAGGAAAAPAAAAAKPLNVLIAAGESVPFIKTGGLADVIDALGRGLAREGHNATVVLPKYAELKFTGMDRPEKLPGAFAVPVNGRVETARLWRTVHLGVTFLFVEHDYYFARDGAYYGKNVDYTDNDERFVFFARAALEAARFVDRRPDVVHAHDWQAALAAPMLEALKTSDPFFARTKSVLTIHNMAYQGRFGRETLKKAGLDGREFAAKRGRWGFNIMDAGIRKADAVTTVSNTYKDEIQTAKFGEELDGLLAERAAAGDLHGIVNGLDTIMYDPGTDPSISAHYDIKTAAEGKAANKLAMQKQLGLPQDASIPVFAIGSRFVRQKGLDLIGSIVPLLAQRGAQLVIVGAGNGEESIEKELAELAKQHPDTLKLHGFSETFVRLAYAASDFLLMPSRFEPCGLSQLIAQRYGSLPLVTRTGGLADTVVDVREDPARGDGLFIHEFSAGALEQAVLAALALHSDQAALARHRHTAMAKDSSWGPAIDRYVELYRSLQ